MVLSNQVLQKLIQDIKKITNLECSVWTDKAECLAMTNQGAKPERELIAEFLRDAAASDETERKGEQTSLFLASGEDMGYVLAVEGDSDVSMMAGRFGVSSLSGMMQIYRERMDKNRFIQNLLLDHMLVVDIYNQAKKMKIPVQQKRVVFVIESKSKGENFILQTLKGMFATGMKDFATSVDEEHVVLVKALEKEEEYEEIQHIAKTMADTLNMEAMVGVRIAYGTIVEDLIEVPRSYKEANMAMEVGRVFYEERTVFSYKVLGIGRLIHQLPESLCEMFLEEVFEGNAVENFEEEELAAVCTFFDNNLNISETARKLYVHRNTLVYRLEKIQKKTGLDVRIFEDALTFKIAMMVEQHMRAKRHISTEN